MYLEHHLVGGYVRYISPYSVIIITNNHNNCYYVGQVLGFHAAG